jgi:hypothetical protein
MTRSPTFDVPDLDLPAPRIATPAPAMQKAVSTCEPVFDFENDENAATSRPLELGVEPKESRESREWRELCESGARPPFGELPPLPPLLADQNRFVSGCAEPLVHVPVSRFGSGIPDSDPPRAEPSAPTTTSALVDAAREIPFSLWKRIPTYAFLAMLLGNGCKCGGLSAGTNVVLVVLVVVGLAGGFASLSQRSP